MKLPIDNVFWAQPIQAGGEFAKSLGTNAQRGIRLWYVGHGVLVEHEGKPDRLVPIGNVLVMEAAGGFEGHVMTAEAAGKFVDALNAIPKRGPGRPPPGLKSVAAMEMDGELPPGSLKIQLQDMADGRGGLAEMAAASIAEHKQRHKDGNPMFGTDRTQPAKRGPGRPPKQ